MKDITARKESIWKRCTGWVHNHLAGFDRYLFFVKAESGRSLPAALITLAVGSLLLTPFLSFVSTRSLGIRAANETLNEQYASDAGVEFGIWTLLNDNTFRAQADANPGTAYAVPFPENINGYSPSVTLTSVPIGEWFTRQDTSPRSIGPGGSLEYAGGNTLYALTGGLSTTFIRYNIATDSWNTRAPIPAWFVWLGSDLVYTGGNHLYATAGYFQRSFYRYNTSTNNWTARADTPNRIFYGGSLVYTGGNHIFAFQGSTRNFWRYSISNNNWTSRANAPAPVGNGAALVYTGGDFIYAFRGNNTNDFWRYQISTNNWTSRRNAPGPVSYGGALAYNGSNYIYALQGGTTSFWRYNIALNTWGTLVDTPNSIGYGGDLSFVDYDSGFAVRGGYQSDYWEFLITPPQYDIHSQAGSVETTARIELEGTNKQILFWDIE